MSFLIDNIYNVRYNGNIIEIRGQVMNYIALMGDIVNSKQTSNSSSIQERLKQQLNRVNHSFAQDFASPFTITKGDEFQALCKPNPYIFLMIDQIQLAFRDEVEIRFGIGLGEILTAIDPKLSIGADGPAYWEAQKALKFIQDKDDYGSSLVAFSSEYKQIDRVINPLLTSSDFIKATWNSSQTDLFEFLISNKIYQEEFKQKPIAEKMKLSQSAFTKRLKSSGIKLYFRNRKTAMDLILQLSQRS